VAPSLEAGTLVPHGAVLGDRLFVFAEALSAKTAWALFAIRPDTTAPAPVLRPLDFSPGTPANRDRVAIAWDEPADPSRIASYRYTWTLDDGEGKVTVLAGGSQRLVLDASTDGDWRLTVWAVDRAGNTTVAPATVTFVRDATPPAPVTMFLQPAPRLDGYQPTNDFTISWVPPPGDLIARYEVSAPLKADGGRLVRQPESLRAENVDDGEYIVTVAAVRPGRQCRTRSLDQPAPGSLPAGDVRCACRFERGPGREPRPAARWPRVQGWRLDAGGLPRRRREASVHLHAQAFRWAVRGRERSAHPGDLLGADFDSGQYRVGVRHAVRGVRFADRPIDFQAPGTVKIGDFRFRWVPRWAAARSSRYHLPFVALLIGLSAGLVALLLVVSSRSLVVTAREGTVLKAEVQALLEGRPALITVEETERRLKALRRRGIGLRVKFSFLVSMLAVIIVAGVSLRWASG